MEILALGLPFALWKDISHHVPVQTHPARAQGAKEEAGDGEQLRDGISNVKCLCRTLFLQCSGAQRMNDGFGGAIAAEVLWRARGQMLNPAAPAAFLAKSRSQQQVQMGAAENLSGEEQPSGHHTSQNAEKLALTCCLWKSLHEQ